MCINLKWLNTHGHSDQPNPVTQDTYYYIDMPIPCGYCDQCVARRANILAMKTAKELELCNNSGYFICLTYDDDSYPKTGLDITDIQKFHKRLRKNHQLTRRDLSYLTCGEYGKRTYRAHYHDIHIGVHYNDLVYLKHSKKGYPIYTSRVLQSLWPHGFSTISPIRYEHIAYVAHHNAIADKLKYRDLRYVTQQERRNRTMLLNPKTPMSRHPQIMRNLKYLDDQKKYLIANPQHQKQREFTVYSRNLGYGWWIHQDKKNAYADPKIYYTNGSNVEYCTIPREWRLKDCKANDQYAIDYSLSLQNIETYRRHELDAVNTANYTKMIQKFNKMNIDCLFF